MWYLLCSVCKSLASLTLLLRRCGTLLRQCVQCRLHSLPRSLALTQLGPHLLQAAVHRRIPLRPCAVVCALLLPNFFNFFFCLC